MRDRIKVVLRAITANERLESRWLNTLSLIEHTGARKISRTVADRHPRLDILDHLADETRQARAFKALAGALLGGGEAVDYFGVDAARRYFHRLDQELSAWIEGVTGAPDVMLNYLLVATMLERRACVLYPLYRAATGVPAVRDALDGVIREGQRHLATVEPRCVALLSERWVDLSAPTAVEHALFEEFWRQLEAELGMARVAA